MRIWALARPLSVLGIVAAIALIFGADDTCDTDWRTAIFKLWSRHYNWGTDSHLDQRRTFSRALIGERVSGWQVR